MTDRKAAYILPSTEVSFFLHRNGEYVSVIQTETPNHMKSAVSA